MEDRKISERDGFVAPAGERRAPHNPPTTETARSSGQDADRRFPVSLFAESVPRLFRSLAVLFMVSAKPERFLLLAEIETLLPLRER